MSSSRVSIFKVGGLVNPADLMTKYLGGDCIRGRLKRMFLVPTDSRLANAPILCSVGEFRNIRELIGQSKFDIDSSNHSFLASFIFIVVP